MTLTRLLDTIKQPVTPLQQRRQSIPLKRYQVRMTWENVGENTLKKENDLMNAYKTAFEGLAEIIRMGQDDNLIRIVDELEGDLKQLKELDTKEDEELLTQEEWENMEYTERVELLNTKPKVYQAAVAGKFKEVI